MSALLWSSLYRSRGCLTCRYGGPLLNDPRDPLTDNRCSVHAAEYLACNDAAR